MNILLNQSIASIVTSLLREAELNKGLIFNIQTNYLIHFDKPIADGNLEKLKDAYPHISFNTDYAEIRSDYNLLFINKCGYYSCLSNIGDMNPQYNNKSEWVFESNHDSCWRDGAFESINKDNRKIVDDLFTIFQSFNNDISIPKHIIPNFSIIDNMDVVKFEIARTNNDYGSINILEGIDNNSNEETIFEINKSL